MLWSEPSVSVVKTEIPVNVGDLGYGWDRRRNAHVEVHTWQVRDDSVPPTVFARKVERLAAETSHVRIILEGGWSRGWESRVSG